MHNRKKYESLKLIFKIFMVFCVVILLKEKVLQVVYAEDRGTNVIGEYYEFDEKSNYDYSTPNTVVSTDSNEMSFGVFSLSGQLIATEKKNGVPAYSIKDGNVGLVYTFDKSKLMMEETKWHVIDDNSKKIDNLSLENKILKGALILQSSLDGESWTEDMVLTNVFTDESVLINSFYTTKDIQQQNGCYYRIIIAYEMKKKTGSHKVVFVKVDEESKKKVVELYKFYLVDSDIDDYLSANSLPLKQLGSKVNTGKDNGYSGNNQVAKEDPHYGWDLGTFSVNGYTREGVSDDVNVFLKNVGDKVTLWFKLKEDINKLNGNDYLTINEDKNGYYQNFEISQTNFGSGTLIIRHKDYLGKTHEPVIYTNYLEANAKTGVDTRIQLFEEGDYEVSLCYEVENDQHQIGSVSLLPSYENYKIDFKFKIRNGNCMVYPFDVMNGNELSDHAITPNGFNLDMAKSRYLTIDVVEYLLKVSSDGTLTEDVRKNSVRKDSEAFSKEGIYRFTVKNLFTDGEPTIKTIYVGDNKYLKALSKYGISVEELNGKIISGAEISDDGFLVEVVADVDESTLIADKKEDEKTQISMVIFLIAAALTVVFLIIIAKKRSNNQKRDGGY